MTKFEEIRWLAFNHFIKQDKDLAAHIALTKTFGALMFIINGNELHAEFDLVIEKYFAE